MNAEAFAPTSLQRGVSKASPSAHRVQRAAALGVFILPTLGTAFAVWQVATRGLRLGELVLLTVGYVLTSLGVTMGYHRHFAHRAFNTGAAMQFVLVALGSMAAQGPLVFWVATHRRHHAYSDRPGDPHSPHMASGRFAKLKGFIHAHMGWMLSDEVTSWPVFARDLMRSPYTYWLHGIYWPFLGLGLLLPALVGWLAWGGALGAWNGFVWGGLVRIWLLNQASWCVGSVSHLVGSRPFVTRDQSANNWLVAFFTGGEGLQNNHHAFPSSAVHALRWWEPDFAGSVIRGCAWLGLVSKVNVPSAHAIAHGRRGADLGDAGRIDGISPPEPS